MKNFKASSLSLLSFWACASLSAMGSMGFAKVIEIQNPTQVTGSSIQYSFSEVSTQPGDEVKFHIPQHLRSQKLTFVILGHHQNPSTHQGGTPGQKQDAVPGISAVLVHSTNLHNVSSADSWRYWNGMASGNMGGKFAEPRYDLEIENLYEWNTIGSRGAQSNDLSYTPLLVDEVVVKNVGQDEVFVGQIVLKFMPNEINSTQEVIFSPGTEFAKEFGGKAHLGGGQAYQGTFPNAHVLNGSQLEIPLESQGEIKGIEVALGDSHPDKISNSDGGWGTQGWGKVSVGLTNASGGTEWLTQGENVPPEGLALAFPSLTSTASLPQVGRKLVIRGSSDTVYIMGVRISYKK